MYASKPRHPFAATRKHPEGERSRRPLPPLEQIHLEALRLDQLREALRANRISFPAPVPVFERHDRPDLQWKFVQLYFVSGWSCGSIAVRYGLMRQRVAQILNTWKRRAVETGFVQLIPPLDSIFIAAAAIPVTRSVSARPLADGYELTPVPLFAVTPNAPEPTVVHSQL